MQTCFQNHTMEKLDLSKKYKSYYSAKTTPELVIIEKAQFISIVGKGDPSGKPFADNIEALYSTAYSIKFAYKAQNSDFVVSKLEGLWWYDENKYSGNTMTNAPVEIPRSEWEYKLLIRMPEFVTKSDVIAAIATVVEKKELALAQQVAFYEMEEGKCVQMLHVGPFATEPETLAAIGKFIEANKYARNGLHHEIYLSDFRKTAAEKLKTILREPVK